MRSLRLTALILLIIGGLNWGLVGLFNYDLVAAIFGRQTFLTRLIYDLVGLSAVYAIFDILPRTDRLERETARDRNKNRDNY